MKIINSAKCARYLLNNGFKIIGLTDDKKFVFEKSSALNDALTEYTANKPAV